MTTEAPIGIALAELRAAAENAARHEARRTEDARRRYASPLKAPIGEQFMGDKARSAWRRWTQTALEPWQEDWAQAFAAAYRDEEAQQA